MDKVGIRKLKNEASAIIRTVREEQAEYIVTYRGEPVAIIRPIDDTAEASDVGGTHANTDFWEKLDKIRVEIDANWLSENTAVELIEKQRRAL